MGERPPAIAVRNPYPGLRPFRTDEEHLFFGRERQVDRMIDKLAAHRFLAVVGTSGSGKSSLVNCGLRPALHRGYMARAGAAWRMAQFRPGSDPIGALARALAVPGVLFDARAGDALETQKLVEATLRLGSLGLVDIIEQARLPAATQVLVVADQFEELFRFRALAQNAAADAYGPTEDAVAFVRLLLEARAQSDVPIYVVLTMRSDFLGDCAQFQGLPEAINDGQYLVPRLTRDEIRAAITGPASVADAVISPVLVTRLLNDVGDNPDQLSILQHALNRTWAQWEAGGRARSPLYLAHYDAAGGMAKALDTHADKAFGELEGKAQRRLCERIFKALTDTGTDARGVRRPQKLATLCDMTGATPAELQAVIDVFRKPSRSFLMPPLAEPLDADSVIDISHESLMRVWKRLRTWADEEAHSARTYRRLRETAALFDAGSTNLWRDPDLRFALDWRAANEPTRAWAELYGGGFESAMAFLDRSRDAQEAERIETEIERRWDAGWRFVPMAIMALVFIYLQLKFATLLEPFAESLKPAVGELGGKAGARTGLLDESLSVLVRWLPHVAAGIPAAVGYMLLAPYARQLYWRKARAEVDRRGGLGTASEKARAATMAEVPAVDVQALGYAGFGRRAFAQLVDWAICFVPILAFIIVTAPPEETAPGADAAAQASNASGAGTTPGASATSGAEAATGANAGAGAADGATAAVSSEDDALVLSFLLFVTVLFYVYHVYFWTSKHQATWGMRLAGVFVTDLQGRRLNWLRATGRFFARWLSYYTMYLGFLMQLFTSRRQTLHDRMSGTLVLRRPPPA